MDDLQYKLYEDEFGVRHWRYRLAGLLLVCGRGRTNGHEGGPYVTEDMFPTCLACIVVMIREEGR